MKILMAGALAMALISLSACASMTGASDPVALLKEVNRHIEKCERHYTGGTGIGAALTFRIDCPALPPETGLAADAAAGSP